MTDDPDMPKSARKMTPQIVRRLRRFRRLWFSRSLWNRRAIFMVGSIVVGLVSVAFARASDYANAGLHTMLAAAAWAPFIVAPMGFAAISFLTERFFKEAQGSGIPQTIASLHGANAALRDRLLSLRVAFGKIVLTLAGLFAGASIGREGPTVQVGASLMYALSRIFEFPHEEMKRGLILAGGAAGIAAAFNAPLAGVVFAIEEMSRSFSERTSGILIAAVVFAGIVSLALLGNYTYFGQTTAVLALNNEFPAVLLCGTLCGLLGGLFSRLLIASARLGNSRIAAFRKRQPYAFAACCGLAIAFVGLASNNTVYGTGYAETKAMLSSSQPIPWSFGGLKLAATLISYASGIPGGIFAPSLAVGAGLGQNIALLFPSSPVAAIMILSMVGYFSGVVQAPITAFVIVIEMTRDSNMALPLMAVSLIAYGLSRVVCPKPLYKVLAKGYIRPSEQSI